VQTVARYGNCLFPRLSILLEGEGQYDKLKTKSGAVSLFCICGPHHLITNVSQVESEIKYLLCVFNVVSVNFPHL
jgi:hypothetical protein